MRVRCGAPRRAAPDRAGPRLTRRAPLASPSPLFISLCSSFLLFAHTFISFVCLTRLSRTPRSPTGAVLGARRVRLSAPPCTANTLGLVVRQGRRLRRERGDGGSEGRGPRFAAPSPALEIDRHRGRQVHRPSPPCRVRPARAHVRGARARGSVRLAAILRRRVVRPARVLRRNLRPPRAGGRARCVHGSGTGDRVRLRLFLVVSLWTISLSPYRPPRRFLLSGRASRLRRTSRAAEARAASFGAC